MRSYSENHQLGVTVDIFEETIDTNLESELSDSSDGSARITRSEGNDDQRHRVSLSHRVNPDSLFGGDLRAP